MKFRYNIILIAILFISGSVFADVNPEDLEVINLEDLYKKEEVKPTQVVQPAVSSLVTDVTTEAVQQDVSQPEKPTEIKVKELKDLNQLVPFSEISVIQRKYMPKSERLQLYLGLGLTTNTPWFTNYGGKVNLSYNFTESIGLELNSLFLTSSPRDVAKEIKLNHNVEADQFIYTKGYLGLDFVWSPIYGKIAYDNSKIINYEMYFSIGGGKSDTNSQEKSVPTGHVGLGQIFSMSKSMAFRWDYGVTAFQATPINATTSGVIEKSTYTDLVLTAGFSFFFPEANYR
jgi:outer membrane beta-barrel protein